MGWSLRLGSIRGIKIKVHYTFLLILAVVITLSGGTSIADLAALLLLFACVLLHELGHSLVAQAHGIRVRDITLLPIGGVARLEEVPENPWTELKIAIAGPAVNLVIFVMLTPLVILVSIPSLSATPGAADALLGFAIRCLMLLWYANFMLMAFNLVPAFPLDGGRVLRAVLAMRMEYLRATEIAAQVGRVFAASLILVGLVGGGLSMVGVITAPGLFWLIVIGAFILLAGTNEVRLVKLRRWRRSILLPDGAELIPPGVPTPPPPEMGRGLLFDFGVYNRREIMEEFERLLKRL